MSTVEERVAEIIANQALMDVKDVRPESTMEDLGIDSLGLVECIFAIEEAFDIQVPFNANDPQSSDFDISNVATVAKNVQDLIKAKA